jgi:ectoine hydroxylase
MILFHSCLVHASGSNLSPFNRVAVYLSLCAVSNHIRRHKRPEYIAHRDFTPITCLPDDCLVKDYPVDLPWKDGVPATAMQTSTDVIAEERKAACRSRTVMQALRQAQCERFSEWIIE